MLRTVHFDLSHTTSSSSSVSVASDEGDLAVDPSSCSVLPRSSQVSDHKKDVVCGSTAHPNQPSIYYKNTSTRESGFPGATGHHKDKVEFTLWVWERPVPALGLMYQLEFLAIHRGDPLD
jgi:hypothetical protein